MGLYARYVLPRVVDRTCSARPAMRQRAKVVPRARGRVLEVGFGTGLNLPFYDRSRVERLWALEPSRAMWRRAGRRVAAAPFGVEHLEAEAGRVPLPDGSADTVLVTYSLCTIPEPVEALAEMRRVLKPDGELVFCEHGMAPEDGVRRWQDRMNPVWRALGGGCNLNRPIPALVEQGGFRMRGIDSMYLPGWKPASFNYWGTAVRRDAGA
jgi:ubiquinone/menaquinone biosynthesis C-methylase UbiE